MVRPRFTAISLSRLSSSLGLLSLAGLLCLQGTALAQEGATALGGEQARPAAAEGLQQVVLHYKTARKWKFTLPEHHWNRIGRSLEIGGRKFSVALEGTALRVDSDGDGKTDVKIEGDSAFLLLKGEGFRHGLRFWNHQGWTFASSAYLKGFIGDTQIRLFDLNNNGRFDEVGKDGILVGNGWTVGLLGRALYLKGKLVQIQVDSGGKSLSYGAYQGKTGKLRLDYETKGKVLSLRIRSSDGQLNFDLAPLARHRGASLELPVGSYRIQGGEIGLGSNRVAVAAGHSKAFEILAGGSFHWNLGGTVKAEFLYSRKGSKLELKPDEIWYYGPGGEEYRNWDPIGKSPTFSICEQRSGNELAKAFFPGTS